MLIVWKYCKEDIHVHYLEDNIMRNRVHWNHITLQLKLKKQFIYNYFATTLSITISVQLCPYKYDVLINKLPC